MTTTQTTTPPKPRRERPKAVRLTDAAAERLREIMTDAQGKYLGVRVGVTTAELDKVAADLFAKHGARSAPARVFRLATSLAEIGVRGPGLRSWRA